MTEHPNRRARSNVMKTQRYQIKYYSLWLLVCLAFIIYYEGTSYMSFQDYWGEILSSDPGRVTMFETHHQQFIIHLIAQSALFLITIGVLAVMMTHLATGWVLSMRRAFSAVRSGDLDFRLELNSDDQLDNVAAEFNEMMDRVQAHVRPPDAERWIAESNQQELSDKEEQLTA